MTAYLNALGVICALGRGQAEVSRSLFAGDCSGMRAESGWVPDRVLPVAGVHGELATIPPELGQQSSRNNQLLLEAALQSARRLLQLGACDAVLCGGVDSLARLTLNGFAALEAVSDGPCNPFSVNRQGINIGEAAALFLMTREPLDRTQNPIALLGAGSTSDAHHISAPEPSGRGAREAMQAALADAGLTAAQIDYLNLHGTATQHNDAMESLAVAAVFPEGVPCSSSKPLTGHTLGAAGALEAAFCWLTLTSEQGLLPPHGWDGQADPALPALQLVMPGQRLPARGPRRLMSNSFAFGGSNVSLILGELP